jgi:guanylate kinase
MDKNKDFNNLIFVFNGPSAGGKTLVLDTLTSDETMGLEKLVTITTRKPRTTPHVEVHGKDYYFLSKEEFLEKVALAESGQGGDAIVEQTEYPKNSGTFYGIFDSEIQRIANMGKDAIAVLDKHGISEMKKFYGEENVISIFVYRDLSSIQQSLKERNLPEEVIKERMDSAMEELKNISITDYVIYNIYDKEALINSAKEIIAKERRKKQLKKTV